MTLDLGHDSADSTLGTVPTAQNHFYEAAGLDKISRTREYRIVIQIRTDRVFI